MKAETYSSEAGRGCKLHTLKAEDFGQKIMHFAVI